MITITIRYITIIYKQIIINWLITVPGFFSRSITFLSMSLYKLSHNDLRFPNTLNKFHKYSNSMAGMNSRLFWLVNLWDLFTANFSIGNDFPAILCLYLGTSLQATQKIIKNTTPILQIGTYNNLRIKRNRLKLWTKTHFSDFCFVFVFVGFSGIENHELALNK